MKILKRFEWLFILCILIADFFLISYAATIPFNGSDETEQVEVSKTISFNPSSLNLPIRNNLTKHGMLTTYCVKAGTSIFNSYRPYAVRFLFVVLGTLGVLFTFLLVRSGLGSQKAFLAAILLSLSQFYIRYVSYATEDSLLLVLVILALLIFYQALQKESRGLMIFLGVILGLGFLAKENMLLLVPTFVLCLFFCPPYRHWLNKKSFYFMIIVMCLVISPFVVENAMNGFSSLKFGTEEAGFGISPILPMLYFGEIISQFIDASIIREAIDCEYPFMHWIVGVLVILGVFYSAIKKEKKDLIKILLVVFFVNAVPFLFIRNRYPERFLNNHDWPSIVVIPGIILAANFLIDIKNKFVLMKYVIAVLLIWLLIHIWYFVRIPEPFFIPRADLQSADFFYKKN